MARSMKRKGRRKDWRTILFITFSVILALIMILAIFLPSIPLGPN